MTVTIYYYQYPTPYGPVTLSPEANGRYKVLYKEENLGSYPSAAAAADDVAGGHTYSPADGVDFSDLNISADLGDWEKKVFASVNRLRKG